MNAKLNESIILCFRDLVTDPGETISRHAALIEQYGYCWWGWWKKPIEDVPTDLLSRLVKSASLAGASIFLYDCGRYRLYDACLVSVAIAPSEAGMSSPELEKTPEYYADRRFGAWYKLYRIEEVGDGEAKLRGMTYIDFPSWRREVTHEAFKGQRVSNFEELDGMQVTFWHVNLSSEKTKS